MKFSRATTVFTLFFFIFFMFIGSNPELFPASAPEDPVISKLLAEAEDHYQNGQFKEAIEIYEQIIVELNKRKELVKTKQKLFTTMVSLALTYFTIQETEKSKVQMEKLIRINPNQEIDEEVYPPKFVQLFKEVQAENLGELTITSSPSGAVVSMDNQRAGTTPLNINKIVKGEHVIVLAKKGYNVLSRKTTVNPGTANTVTAVLEKAGGKKVIEKKGTKKKKKKLSPILLIGGLAAIGAILLLVLKKKDDPEPTVRILEFTNESPVPINALVPAYSFIEAAGIVGKVRKVEYTIRINHPRIEDLTVALIGTDNRTLFSVWNKGAHEDGGKTFTGATEVFNSITPNGNWKVTVSNSGQRKTGEIAKWSLKIFYIEN